MSRKSRRKTRNIVLPRREPTENDLEAIRLLRGDTAIRGGVDTLKTIVKWGSIASIFISIYKSVNSIVTGVSGLVNTVADVLTTLYVRDIIYWIAIVLLVGANAFMRIRNRRLTELVGILRHALEKNEPANTRSGLNPSGESTEDKE